MTTLNFTEQTIGGKQVYVSDAVSKDDDFAIEITFPSETATKLTIQQSLSGTAWDYLISLRTLGYWTTNILGVVTGNKYRFVSTQKPISASYE